VHGAHGARAEARSAKSTCCSKSTKQIEGHTICALGDAAAWPIQGLMRHFRRSVIEERIDQYTYSSTSDGAGCRDELDRGGVSGLMAAKAIKVDGA
jgi:hypothetical protein